MVSNGPASLQEAHPQAQAAARGSSVGQGSAASIAGEVAVLQHLLFRCLLSESMHQGKHQLASANCNQLHGAREDTLNCATGNPVLRFMPFSLWHFLPLTHADAFR